MKPLIFAPTLLTRRRALGGLAALAATSLMPGCGGVSPSASLSKGIALNPQPVPDGSLTSASVTVTTTSSGSIGPAFAGLAYDKSKLYGTYLSATNSNLLGLFNQLGPSLLRIGGTGTDKNIWTPDGQGRTAGQIAPADVDSLAAFMKASGWKCLYGVNLGGAAIGATTPALAAAEVAYVAEQFGTSLLGIEIGNEPDLYGNAGSYSAGNWSLAQFEALWSQFREAILAMTPGVAVTGPSTANNAATWTVPFGEAVTKAEISLLTQHYYHGNGKSAFATAEHLLKPDEVLQSDLSTLETGSQAIGIPFRLAECNSYDRGGSPGVSNAYASSLWMVDFLYECAQGGASGVNLNGGGHGAGYQPIADENGAVIEIRPEYYGILLFILAGQGTLYQTQVAAGSLNVTAYAVSNASGGSNVIVLNKESTKNLQLTIQLPQGAGAATLLEMTQLTAGATGPSLAALSGVTIQGASVGLDGSFSPAPAYTLTANGSQVMCYVPALSAVLIQAT